MLPHNDYELERWGDPDTIEAEREMKPLRDVPIQFVERRAIRPHCIPKYVAKPERTAAYAAATR